MHRKHGSDTTALRVSVRQDVCLQGDKAVRVKSIRSGWGKQQAALVIADEIPYVKPDIYFKGTNNPALQESYYGEERKHYDPRVDVHLNKKGYCNEITIVKYIWPGSAGASRAVAGLGLLPASKSETLLAVDSAPIRI